MSWRPIDFHGIVDLDHKIVEQLENFLQERENRLAYQILNLIPTPSAEAFSPTIPLSGNFVKLSEAVEGFSKKVRSLPKANASEQAAGMEMGTVVQEMNSALWEFTEVLEGVVVELFQQVRQVPIDRWHVSISQVVHTVKDILIHAIEDLMWAIRRLEKPLKEFGQKVEYKSQNRLFSWIPFGEHYLDRELLHNLQQTEKFLKIQYEAFQERYNQYMVLSVKVEESLQKMRNFPILALLDVQDQNLYIDIFRLLKMIELNPHPKSEVAVDTARALKLLTSIDNVLNIFRQYYLEIKDALFNTSLEWKSLNHEGENFDEAVEKLQGKVKEYQQELQELMKTMSHYRTFMLKNDPNPYVRSRWGFTEWVAGPEPAKAQKLRNMIYSAQETDGYINQFSQSLALDPLTQENIENEAKQEIDKLLHEMGQPLISRAMMRSRAERLLNELQACDEIGSPHMSTIDYLENVISKALREDWKYHVLHEFPLFHQIYRLHQGLIEYFEDPAHAFRMERFHLLFDQIEEWIEKEDIYSHVHEIELDMNDMKTYLQDYLATVQRAIKEKSNDPFLDETAHKLRHQLLEYRYLFGQFFLSMMSKSLDGMQLRNQFLFVDQYFESAENQLNELRESL